MNGFESQRLPEIYVRNGKECYLDPIRQRLIYITPEETVRQHVVYYLLDELKVPAKMIRVEEHLSHYGLNTKNRADIIIEKYDDKQEAVMPLVVIECKAPSILLGENVVDQMTGYADELGCSFCMMTNGTDIECFYYDLEKNQYIRVKELPDYTAMIKEEFVEAPVEERFPRLTLKEIDEHPRAYVEIGDSTSDELAKVCINLWECLLYTEHKLPTGKYGIFDVVQDYGVRLMSYGNASGGALEGAYRSFIIEYKGNTEFVSFGMCPYCTDARPDYVRTCLSVAIDTEESSHNSLELIVDENVELDGNKVNIFHHGRISVGKIGSGKKDDLKKMVAESAPELIDGNRFILGSLTNNHLWNLDEPEVTKYIENMITYALIRDEYRKIRKAEMKSRFSVMRDEVLIDK